MTHKIDTFFQTITQDGPLYLTVNHHTQDLLNIDQWFDQHSNHHVLKQDFLETGCVFARPTSFLEENTPTNCAPTLPMLFKEEMPHPVADFLNALHLVLSSSLKETDKCLEDCGLRASLELSIVPRHHFYCPDTKAFVLEELEDYDTSRVSEETTLLFIVHHYHNPNSYSMSIAQTPEALFRSLVDWGLHERRLDPRIIHATPSKWQLLLVEAFQNHQWDDHYGPMEDYQQSWHKAFSDMIKNELPQKELTIPMKKM